ncbi:hypothetical protein A0H81_10912 [Grifola frondosa]|uniref:Uncharacterized protein n=1 Tax=Grifola frondosa TaxID=5627 RepID=A0A1C7LYE5_GRIFR|nr:hypothetical protein A0H81_10912 [Grifola frondosa]
MNETPDLTVQKLLKLGVGMTSEAMDIQNRVESCHPRISLRLTFDRIIYPNHGEVYRMRASFLKIRSRRSLGRGKIILLGSSTAQVSIPPLIQS